MAAAIVLLLIGGWLQHRLEQRAFAERTACVGNLVRIRLAKIAYQEEKGLPDGARIPADALAIHLFRPLEQIRCPNGGTYRIGVAGVTPECSHTNVCHTRTFDWKTWTIDRRSWTHSLGY